MRIIKRYLNRKLYDTQDSKYITIPEIATLVKRGEEITVIDSQKNDITINTLKQVLITLDIDKETILSLIDLNVKG
jgi:polyhydroxyalkanoate synthesis repressor PhaR